MHLLDKEKDTTQERWQEEKDSKGRLLRPRRPAHEETEVDVRVGGSFRAVLRLPSSVAKGPGRETSILSRCQEKALGEEIAPGIQVVEVLTRFTPAALARVQPEERDEKEKITRPEAFLPAVPERVDYLFTLRLNGLHLTQASLTEDELSQSDWKQKLAERISR